MCPKATCLPEISESNFCPPTTFYQQLVSQQFVQHHRHRLAKKMFFVGG
jgi:hypothetical protein